MLAEDEDGSKGCNDQEWNGHNNPRRIVMLSHLSCPDAMTRGW